MIDGTAVLETVNLGKRYRRKWGLQDCTLTIPKGRVAALVGPNGAGKSTLLRMAAGLDQPSVRRLRELEESPNSGNGDLKERVGYLDECLRMRVHRQLVDQVREAVIAGRLKPGDRPPPIREVVTQITIDPNTVHRAAKDTLTACIARARSNGLNEDEILDTVMRALSRKIEVET